MRPLATRAPATSPTITKTYFRNNRPRCVTAGLIARL